VVKRPAFILGRSPGFTLIEVALILAIIGMMILMIIGYLMAPKAQGPLPPVETPKLILSSPTPAPAATPARTIELAPDAGTPAR